MRKETKSNIGVVLIAAGASRRLGQPKQLVQVRKKPLIVHVIEQIQSSDIDHLAVILGANKSAIDQVIPDQVEIIDNPDWDKGMSTSIVKGVQSLGQQCDAIMVCVVDQYAITPSYINQLIELYNSQNLSIVASQYGKEFVGVPAIFDKSQYDGLLNLSGDRGAGKIIKLMIKNGSDKVAVLDFKNGHLDVDTPDDILEMKKYFRK